MDTKERQLWDSAALAGRWGISKWSVKRLMDHGDLRSVTIGARRLVPLAEIERAELVGAGKPRAKRSGK